ncbi:Recombination protein RecR [Thalassovita autumnalis]|uniref:Recombination protein RecR n=2 Tax=Thalassovita autumnalis TaxID=2072972 RepID=A0A0P1FKK5_9RHOB|nr:Recombination protein RecR [Thalassovita autumnalis]CUH74134.1 Recombination protein RecR [Thalassovita autumnalis]
MSQQGGRCNRLLFFCCSPSYRLHMSDPAPKDIDNLIELLAKLPGLGPRSARRAVLHMIRKRALLLTPLADQMQRVAETARECLNCGNVGTADICNICADEKRGNGILCVVEDVADLWAMERAAVFKGRYHVLGGTLSALDAVGPEELRIPQLLDRVTAEGIGEVILALNATVDGQTTGHYIADQLEGQVTLTSLAQGVPIGGELDYLDEGTISAALNARRQI